MFLHFDDIDQHHGTPTQIQDLFYSVTSGLYPGECEPDIDQASGEIEFTFEPNVNGHFQFTIQAEDYLDIDQNGEYDLGEEMGQSNFEVFDIYV